MKFWILLFYCTISVINAQNVITDESYNIDSNSINPSARLREDTDNHKPMFKQCESYQPSIQEEQKGGLKVVTVKAEDIDPIDNGGKISYQIIDQEGKRIYFKVNNETGEIVTDAIFDRDEPARQKELYVTVQATDNGKPPLSDICTFKVTVTDINDNAPSFDTIEYDEKVTEDLKKNSEVARIFAYDSDDGENSKLTYSFGNEQKINEYFIMDSATGVVRLKKSLTGMSGTKLSTTVTVHDNGKPQLSSLANLDITVVTSEKQAPVIVSYTKDVVLKENFNDFSQAIINITAESNSDDKELVFELMKGKTAQTNKDQTFILTQDQTNQSASIRMARNLDYETVTEYHLTIRVKNNDLVTSVNIPIKVTDVNDEIPTFLEFLKGSVLENDAPGAQVMQVRAVDKDGTPAHNIVKYKLLNYADLFDIDENTGVITTKAEFDREKNNTYHITVQAYDNSPSALTCCDPNKSSQKFTVSIEDRNDNKPKFEKNSYVVQNISEQSDIGTYVIEVLARDPDTASDIHYSIIEGNEGDAFSIEESTGRIKVQNNLDYEQKESYKLTVRAFDNVFEDTASVVIYISNENDEKPIFEPYNKTIELEEEKTYENCIITLRASDPDIKDKTADQNIIYKIDKKLNYDSILHVSSDGCVTVIQPLDRDKPNGYPQRQFHIGAYDNGGGPNSLVNYAEIFIYLKDINDNAPFLNVTQVVFYENQEPNKMITKLSADDYDSAENGPPFSFRLSLSATDAITQKFSIQENGDLYANVQFDREAQKYYDIPVEISDSGSPTQTGTSMFRVIIGDRNDNPAEDGSSEIFVYKYEGLNKDIEIGRVYVTDPDDWDLNDKVFQFEIPNENFELSETNKGMILMKSDAKEGSYMLHFRVTEEHLPDIVRHEVQAVVNVTIKGIPEEAVRKSGSVRILGSSIEAFVEKTGGFSKKDILQRYLAKMLNTSIDNVDVLTVIQSPSNDSLIDVRFSAHGSPYYKPEKINAKVTENEDELEKQLGVQFIMISISECLNETVCAGTTSCTNSLSIKDEPAVVFTNLTSFVGVKAVAEAVCECAQRRVVECFNKGTLLDNGLCSCPEGFEGPNCEILGIGFGGKGWALYPSLDACNDTKISLSILTSKPDGLIFYIGPENYKHAVYSSKEFMSLELQDGILVLKLFFGYDDKTIKIDEKQLDDGKLHTIIISFTDDDIQLKLDECPSTCLSWQNKKGVLNTNGPLQLGGMRNPFSDEHAKLLWGQPLTNKGFEGCIKNFTFNDYMYNLGDPSYHYDAHINCLYGVTAAVSFGIDSNFLVAILVCVAILIILLLAVVVHRRKQDNLNEKDNDDTRENIINYEDEGGGEYDTQFDLSVFPPKHDEKPQSIKALGEIPADINTFLVNKKDTCDKDQDNLPFDDVRYYAYEGDGNSTGSLSSLASCTDEGDLKFNYLSNFGPRFRKLADMYGEDPSDEDSQNGGEESWC